MCLLLQRHTYISASIKGAREGNEDAIFADGRLFGLFDGHSGATASARCRSKLSHFFHEHLQDTDVLSSRSGSKQPLANPVVKALHSSFVDLQACLPSASKDRSGSTGIVCWLSDAKDGADSTTVYAACCGDSQAVCFDAFTGRIPDRKCRLFDHEMGTIDTGGEDAFLPYETTPHAITGALQKNASGEIVSMENDPTGVGFREYQLLRRKNPFPNSPVPRCISNMPGEFRWRLLDLEPTRALGHGGKKWGPLHSPEIYQWHVEKPEQEMLLLCCDGFFSKSAFASMAHLTSFLVDPRKHCQRADFFHGTCFEALMRDLREPMPSPEKLSMGTLFKFIYKSLNAKLCDAIWRQAHESAYEYLCSFAQERPTPNIRTAPAQTLLAACYLASLMASDDNVSCTLVMLDHDKLYGDGDAFENGMEHGAQSAASPGGPAKRETETDRPAPQRRLHGRGNRPAGVHRPTPPSSRSPKRETGSFKRVINNAAADK